MNLPELGVANSMILGEVVATDGESGFELGRHFPSDKE